MGGGVAAEEFEPVASATLGLVPGFVSKSASSRIPTALERPDEVQASQGTQSIKVPAVLLQEQLTKRLEHRML